MNKMDLIFVIKKYIYYYRFAFYKYLLYTNQKGWNIYERIFNLFFWTRE